MYLSIKIPGFGYSVVKPENFDTLIAKFLPSSPAKLKTKIRQRAEGTKEEKEWIDGLTTVTECLMVLAEYEGLAQ